MRLQSGQPGRELFALHLPAAAGCTGEIGVLMCNPFGQEAIRAHRLYRVLGERLQAAGCQVLRFDYFGTGDSAGDDAQFELDGALADTLHLADLLQRRMGVRRLVLLGMRLGASIATLASLRLAQPPAGLVLLDPVLDGAAYRDQLREAHEQALREAFGARWSVDAALREACLASSAHEALGFALSPLLLQQLDQRLGADIRWPGRAERTLVLASPESGVAGWQGERLSLQLTPSDIDWATNSAINTAIVPTRWVERILQFVRQELLDA